VSVKKAKGKGKGPAKKSAKKSTKKSAKKSKSKTKKPVDMGRVRENINNLVGASAKDIANEVIKVAKTGQLASAKYLFEAVGLYPPTEQTAANPIEHSLAHTLLTRMGLPLEPVICDEEPAGGLLTGDTKGAAPGPVSMAEEDPKTEDEPASVPAESEE
jgi:hypothetical protein